MSENDVGFVIAGGRNHPHCGGSDGAVYVTSVTKDGPFERKLRWVAVVFIALVTSFGTGWLLIIRQSIFRFHQFSSMNFRAQFKIFCVGASLFSGGTVYVYVWMALYPELAICSYQIIDRQPVLKRDLGSIINYHVISATRKRQQKRWNVGSGNSFLYILSYEKTKHRGRGESNVSVNPGLPCHGYHLDGDDSTVNRYIDIITYLTPIITIIMLCSFI